MLCALPCTDRTIFQQILMTVLRTLTSKSCVRSEPTTAHALCRMITHDILRFSNHLAAIYSNLAKPTLDVILYNYQLSRNVGAEGLVLLTILVQSSAALRASRVCSLSFQSLTSISQSRPSRHPLGHTLLNPPNLRAPYVTRSRGSPSSRKRSPSMAAKRQRRYSSSENTLSS